LILMMRELCKTSWLEFPPVELPACGLLNIGEPVLDANRRLEHRRAASQRRTRDV
jgi:hypothetical protein